MTPNLTRRAVFLSASFPSGERGKAFEPYDAGAISDAVSAYVRVVLSGGDSLVFGGHPTITPLVLLVAGEVGVREKVIIYQSRWFANAITPETYRLEELGLGTIRWVESGEDLEESLASLRETMLQEVELLGGAFVGGMKGILTEFEMFRELWGGKPALPVVAPGGAARQLMEKAADVLPDNLIADLETERYPELFFAFMQAIRSAAE